MPEAKETPEEPTVAFIHQLAQDGLTKAARFAYGHMAIFNAVNTLVMVKIIRLTIGQNQQKFSG